MIKPFHLPPVTCRGKGFYVIIDTDRRGVENDSHGVTIMEPLLAISMISTIIIMGMWVWSSFKWQGWGK